MKENKFAIGSFLGKGAFNHWFDEQFQDETHVRYLHTKYMLVDPLGDNPMVVCGSANFSDASTTNNDENMLIIRGNPRVADIYLGRIHAPLQSLRFSRLALPNTRIPTKRKSAISTRPTMVETLLWDKLRIPSTQLLCQLSACSGCCVSRNSRLKFSSSHR